MASLSFTCRSLPDRPYQINQVCTARLQSWRWPHSCRTLKNLTSFSNDAELTSRHVFGGELVRRVRNEQTSFTDGTVANDDTFDGLHLRSSLKYKKSKHFLFLSSWHSGMPSLCVCVWVKWVKRRIAMGPSLTPTHRVERERELKWITNEWVCVDETVQLDV